MPGLESLKCRAGLSTSHLIGILLGIAMLQAAWIIALPPFMGADEVDHVYRASAVASGDWAPPPSSATRGTGALVLASPDMVRAAEAACLRLPYKVSSDCALATSARGDVVPSAAGRYSPAYYVLVGYVTRVADGVAGAYLMRILSAGLCLLLLAFALDGLRRWADGRWVAGALLGVTPTVVYSTTVVAPNGLEMVAGLGMWTALAGLAHGPVGDRRRHVLLAAFSASALVSLRSLGPMWATLIGVACLVAWPGLWGRLRGAFATPAGLAGLLFVVGSGLASLAWTLSQRSLIVSRDGPDGALSAEFTLLRSLQEVPLWLLQAIAAFPFRNQPAPLVVYPSFLLVAGLLLVVSWRAGTRRLRSALALAWVAGLAIPFGITLATLEEFGTAWQGRYALPLLIGSGVLMGAAWVRSDQVPAVSRRTAGVLMATLVVVHAAGVAQVAWSNAESEWLTPEGMLPHVPAWSVGVLAVVAAAIASGATVRALTCAARGRTTDALAR